MQAEKSAPTELIPVGISSCLLGERVRYDGGHKKNTTLLQVLGPSFELKSFCPEVSIGLGVPRIPIRLCKTDQGEIRCVNVDDNSKDYTEELEACSEQQQAWQKTLCGYVFKKDSPSCGMAQVKVWSGDTQTREGQGIYAKKLMKDFPYLPVEEEGGLEDELRRENFLQRVFALYRWKKLTEKGITVNSLEEFHRRHELLIKSRSAESVEKLGGLIANTANENLVLKSEKYLVEFMAVLQLQATR